MIRQFLPLLLVASLVVSAAPRASSASSAFSDDHQACMEVIRGAHSADAYGWEGYTDVPIARCQQVIDGNVDGKAQVNLLSQQLCLFRRFEGSRFHYAAFFGALRSEPSRGPRQGGGGFSRKSVKRDSAARLVIEEREPEIIGIDYDREAGTLELRRVFDPGLFSSNVVKEHFIMRCSAID